MTQVKDNLRIVNDIIHETIGRYLISDSTFEITKSKIEIFNIVKDENNNLPVADNTLKILINFYSIQGIIFNGGW